MFKFFWGIKALPSIHVTTWRVLENKIASKVNLVRRGVVVDSIFCCFCGLKEESTNHLFFGCRISCLVWNLWLAWLGLVSVAPQDSYSHFLQFNICNALESVNLVLGSVDCDGKRDLVS